MPITNPSPILHQNISMAMKMKPEEKEISTNTLMGPPKRSSMNKKGDDILQPSKRIASYIELIKSKREELKNA
jgi:hypothetical protein